MFIQALFQYIKSAGANFHVVVPGELYRAATPSPANLRKWKRDYDIKTWVDLRMPKDYSAEKAFLAQVDMARELGIRRISLPCSDKDPMPDSTLTVGVGLLSNAAMYPMLFGCKGNRHRAGMLCAVFRMRVMGWTKEAAMDEAHKCGYYPDGHREFDKRFMEVLDSIGGGAGA